MRILISLVTVFVLLFLEQNLYAKDKVYPTSAEHCTRGTNPLQDAKDLAESVQEALSQASQALDHKDTHASGKMINRAKRSYAKMQVDLGKHYRSVPATLDHDLNALFKDSKSPKSDLSGISKQTSQLQKSIDDFAATLGCPQSLEPVFVDLLPPEPGKKANDEPPPIISFNVYSFSLADGKQLIQEWPDVPFGDCPKCKRGVSLNCQSPRQRKVVAVRELDACKAGLNLGVGIRLEMTGDHWQFTAKNGSKYSVTSPAERAKDGAYMFAPGKTHSIVFSKPSSKDPTKSIPVYEIELVTTK